MDKQKKSEPTRLKSIAAGVFFIAAGAVIGSSFGERLAAIAVFQRQSEDPNQLLFVLGAARTIATLSGVIMLGLFGLFFKSARSFPISYAAAGTTASLIALTFI